MEDRFVYNILKPTANLWAPLGRAANGFNENLTLFSSLGKAAMWIDATVAGGVKIPKTVPGCWAKLDTRPPQSL